jgi:hypothetical protein
MIEPLDALLETVRAGTGAIVVVEGQTPRDDPYYYGRWFGDVAREVRFVHQNGHSRVKTAVAFLREAAPGRPVFGLVDRDFTSRDTTEVVDPLGSGIFRTGLYTLENYFLTDLAAWLSVAMVLCAGEPPPEWRTVQELQARVDEAYRSALPVAAWNRVVHDEVRRGMVAKSPGYRDHPDAISDEGLRRLEQWGVEQSAPVSLRAVYEAELAAVTALGPEGWPERVTGKVVGAIFAAKFPALDSARDKARTLYRLYMDKQNAPPADLAAIVETIRREAAKMRKRG